MKKIVSVILILASILALSACNFFGDKDFKEAMENTNPRKVTITTTTTTAGLGTLSGDYAVTYNNDNTATIKYNCEIWLGIPTDGSEIGSDVKTKLSGTVTRDAEGKYSDATFVEDVELVLSLDIEAISEYTVSEDGKTLTATIAKNDTQAVFGVAYGFDVALTLVKGSRSIESVSLAYTSGINQVSVKCVYD